MRRQREETSATTDAVAAQTASHPVITKLPLLNRVFRFACNIATAPFTLAAVTSTWNETLTDPEWGCADALFESLADAGNTNLSEQQVKAFWRTAVFMLKNGKNIELLATLDRAIDKENQKAAAEFAAGDKTAVAKHRMLQQQGAILATFRDVTGIPADWGWSMDTPLSRWKKIALHDNGSVKAIFVMSCRLSGSIAWESLPAALNWLRLHTNQFSGSVNLEKLPSAMKTLFLNDNHFSGSVCLDKLPSSMQRLHLAGNQFSGSVSLDKLPSSMVVLQLQNNQFSGSVSLDKLPAALTQLFLHNNQFSGSVSLDKLPAALTHLGLGNNQFSGSVSLDKLPSSMQELRLDNNQFSGSVSLDKLPAALTQLLLHNNQFSGSVSLEQLPSSMQGLDIRGNNWAAKPTRPAGFNGSFCV